MACQDCQHHNGVRMIHIILVMSILLMGQAMELLTVLADLRCCQLLHKLA